MLSDEEIEHGRLSSILEVCHKYSSRRLLQPPDEKLQVDMV